MGLFEGRGRARGLYRSPRGGATKSDRHQRHNEKYHATYLQFYSLRPCVLFYAEQKEVFFSKGDLSSALNFRLCRSYRSPCRQPISRWLQVRH